MTLELEVAQSVAAVLKPVLSDLKALQGQMASWEARWNDLGALRERVAVLEVRAPVPGPAGEQGAPGRDGVDGSPGMNGKDGLPGMNGKDGANGLDGKDGAAGIAGQDGAPGLNGKDGAPGLAGKDGANGLDGKDGAAGLNGKDGAAGLNGQDGVGLTSALIDRSGQLVLTLSDGRSKDVGLVVGKDGAPGLDGKDGNHGLDGKDGAPGLNGKDGVDGLHGKDGAPGLNGKDGAAGLGFDDLDLVFKDTEGWLLQFTRGEQTKSFPLPIAWDAGPWQSGRMYPKGAGVMAKGCYWVAQAQTSARPGDESVESRAWRLTVKCGRDGKPGRDGRDGVAE